MCDRPRVLRLLSKRRVLGHLSDAQRHFTCQFTFACDGKRKTINERGAWARANRIAKQTLDGQIYVPEVAKSTHYHAIYVRRSG